MNYRGWKVRVFRVGKCWLLRLFFKLSFMFGFPFFLGQNVSGVWDGSTSDRSEGQNNEDSELLNIGHENHQERFQCVQAESIIYKKEKSLHTTALSVYSALQLKYFRNGGKYFCGHCQVNVPVINGVLDTINHPPPVLFDLLLKYLGHTQVDYPHPFSVRKQWRLMCMESNKLFINQLFLSLTTSS